MNEEIKETQNLPAKEPERKETTPFNILEITDEMIDAIVDRYNKFTELQKKLLKENVDYGYPAKRRDQFQKPSLYKSGAEKLSQLFKFIPRFKELRVVEEPKFVFYKIQCDLVKIIDGEEIIFGTGFGVANSAEKTHWAKNPLGNANSILKIAKKRAHVDAVLTTLGASTVFTQDLEDFEDEQLNEITHTKPMEHTPHSQAQVVHAQDKQLNYINNLIRQIAKKYKKDEGFVLSTVLSLLPDGIQFKDLSTVDKSTIITFLKMLNNPKWNPVSKKILSENIDILTIFPILRDKYGKNFEDDVGNVDLILEELEKKEIPIEYSNLTDETVDNLANNHEEPPF